MSKTGFTLIELMVVTTIIGILAAIVTPKMGLMINRAKDAKTKGNLGVIRSAITLYYTENEGLFPTFPPPYVQPAGYGALLENALVPRYLSSMPQAAPSGSRHAQSSDVYLVWNLSGNQDNEPTSGWGWTYDANPFDDLKPAGFKGLWGTIKVLCRHVDSKGINWSTY